MQNLVHQRCFHHAGREAVARCLECKQYYCRECVTEHEDRVLCASCLKNLTRQSPGRRAPFVRLLRAAQCALGVLIAWFFFFLIGESLSRLPASFHEGTLWKVYSVDRE